MAFVVGRRGGSWEVRESVRGGSGPRARTLAAFRVLTDEVLDAAARAATRPFDRRAVREAAWRAGAPVAEPAADRAARTLIAEAAAGRPPSPALGALVVEALPRRGPRPGPETVEAASEWMAASWEARGEALRDLLALTDRFPARRRGALRFPGLRVSRGE